MPTNHNPFPEESIDLFYVERDFPNAPSVGSEKPENQLVESLHNVLKGEAQLHFYWLQDTVFHHGAPDLLLLLLRSNTDGRGPL